MSLKPGESKTATISYQSEEAGIFRGFIEVASNGKSFLTSIDVNATVVDYMQFLID